MGDVRIQMFCTPISALLKKVGPRHTFELDWTIRIAIFTNEHDSLFSYARRTSKNSDKTQKLCPFLYHTKLQNCSQTTWLL